MFRSMKNIALFIDGTTNCKQDGFHHWRDTNVIKLFKAVRACDGPGQISQYLCGVGSGGYDIPPTDNNGKVFRRDFADVFPIKKIEMFLGQAAGLGSLLRIKESYRFLVKNYKPGDRIFLFGFSRGAFAARMLSDFIGKVGILLEPHLSEVNDLFNLFLDGKDHSEFDSRLEKLTANQKKDSEAPVSLPVYFIGLWDTVAAIGGGQRITTIASADN